MTPRPPRLEASFQELAAAVPATIGIAVARPDVAAALSLGRWSSGVAWSTIKVPLAIAALRRDPARAHDLVVKAITESSNEAAERLWSQLGDPARAALRVQAVVHDCGDAATVVESQRIRPPFTAFGQTQWPLDRQARFAAGLPGIGDAATVIDLMRRLTPDQRWGLAAKGIAAKAGWGPGLADDYLVRQVGIVPTESAYVGVALAAEARAFDAGVEVINAMTDWLVCHLPAITLQ
ncbi:hypothetical protein A5787_17685 [Mycobacterium sp. 852002-50816_SCH5313054-b]|uniref:hypothetical protein n=1 Tax=Mycobacterium sp. 852002-50816_SCH5313054-b TaxID=1834092 RepID=UPI0007FFE8D2|nr:hypothetical protein [Mycobacterium sp. 852002-50816_SCH5313054-b]OBF61367.1 hypothetical protein A5787_17685 [Mycobacterium sp. 852002-50816_SCH5313054-b]